MITGMYKRGSINSVLSRARHGSSYARHDGFNSAYQNRLPPDHDLKVNKAYYDCLESLKKYDKSSELLYHYIPEPARPAFVASKCFNLEMNKINIGGRRTQSANSALSSSMGYSVVDLKFKFWEDILYKLETQDTIMGGEPIAMVLKDSMKKGLNIDVNYLSTYISNRKLFLKNPIFRSIDDICSYGEGTYSQLNYFCQGLLLSPNISPSTISLLEQSTKIQSLMTDIAAHIGQATAVATLITGLSYYAKNRDEITLPLDILAKNDLSQESIFRIFQGHVQPGDTDFESIILRLKEVVFETSIAANDHVLAARQKFNQLNLEIKQVLQDTDDNYLLTQSKNWLKQIPDALYVPFMSILPIELYLKKLEKNDFDIFDRNLTVKDWKLLWRSYRNYNQRLL